jgi:hypothetical protein
MRCRVHGANLSYRRKEFVKMSKSIAALIGPTLVAVTISMLLNFNSIPVLAQQVARDPGLILLTGILLLVAGLSIVRLHNVWTGGWPVLVTIFGWLAIFGGLIRLFFPFQLATIAAEVGRHTTAGIPILIVLFLAGVFLTYKAWSQ